MATCRELGCNRKATHTVVVNAPGRGYAEGPICGPCGEKAKGRVYVRDVYRREGGDEA